MTTEQLIGVIAVLVGLLLAITAFTVKWILDRNKEDITGLKADRDKAMTELAVIHERQRVGEEDRRGLREWKHTVVDPYLPRALDDQNRRLERIERHLNGQLK